MSLDLDQLYALLPAIHRLRDHDQGEPLRALLGVIAEQVAVLEENLDQIYDDQFIETCAEWVVPYIGELIGTRLVHDIAPTTFSQRAQVANTLAYRRRKGTLAVLEQLARDVTAWPARAVEFFDLLVVMQHLNHVRPAKGQTASVRDWQAMAQINTPFDTTAHSVDVRRIASERGLHNIPNIGLFLWRLAAYRVSTAPAARVDDRRYTFSPLGSDVQLFNTPETETALEALAQPINVPGPITRRMLHEDLALFYGADKSIHLTVDGEPIPLEQIVACNLADASDGTGWAHEPTDQFGIDPVLGRIAIPANRTDAPETVEVRYHYGFSADIGGGEYGRGATFSVDLANIQRVTTDTSIAAALTALGSNSGVIEIGDSGHYAEAPALTLADGQTIEIRAADGERPLLRPGGTLEISGASDSVLILNGLLISGGTLRVRGNLLRLVLRHCTLVPGVTLASDGTPQQPETPSLVVESTDTEIELDRCITGGLRTERSTTVHINSSMIDATAPDRFAYAAPTGSQPGGALRITSSTVVGAVTTRLLDFASNTIFMAEAPDADTPPVQAERLQQGCVRFSSVPPGSRVPRRFNCQPADGATVQPQFTTLRYGAAAYAQLSRNCPVEIRRGADDESEMGVFHDLYGPLRTTNLQIRLDEYLRFGLEAGIFFVT